MRTFLVEIYLSTPQPHMLDDLAARARDAAEAVSREGVPVRYLQTVLVPEEETYFLLFEASSADAVRAVEKRAGFVATRIVEAISNGERRSSLSA